MPVLLLLAAGACEDGAANDTGGLDPLPRWSLVPAGERAGHVIVERNVVIRHADAEHVWAIESDELGVESVVRFRIERP